MTEEDSPAVLPTTPYGGSAENDVDAKESRYGNLRESERHDKESEHSRTWHRNHSIVLYLTVVAVAGLGSVLVWHLILPVWKPLTGFLMELLKDPGQVDYLKPLGKGAATSSHESPIFPSEVWIAIITAPLLAVSGLAWATFHALSGQKNLPRVKAGLFGEIGQSKDKGTD